MQKDTLNIDYLEAIANGDVEFLQSLIAIVKAEFPEERKQFKENFNAETYALAAENVHKIKHKINMFGLEQGYQVAQQFESELKQGETHSHQDFEAVLDTLENFIISL
jgi:HPt (histidine-containing phosphotransfer) domain-containing protein